MRRAIFISYRRDDAEGEAGRLYDDLVRAYNDDSVFMDVAGIAPGFDFRKAIDDNVSGCGVFLAIIGPKWTDITGANGQRRLEDANDFVRLEIASALARNIAVIPVLVHEARMPHPDQLPDNIKDLAYRNSVEISHARWNSDVQLLINALKQYVETTRATQTEPVHATVSVQLPPPVTPHSEPAPAKSKLPAILGASIAALLLLAVASYFLVRRAPPKPAAVPIAAQTAFQSPSQSPTRSPSQASAAPTAQPASSALPGMWQIVNENTGNDHLSRLWITGVAPNLRAEAIGTCGQQSCSWGTSPLTFDGNDAIGNYAPRNIPDEIKRERNVTMRMHPTGDQLEVQMQNHYKSGRDLESNFTFHFTRAQNSPTPNPGHPTARS